MNISKVEETYTIGWITSGVLVFSVAWKTAKLIRSKFGLPESPASDCLTHCFCEFCALCQEYRELKNRGLDPSLGWHGNMQVVMAPPMGQYMKG
ncbi:unnamed protein product [Thlaspi arvense]|uniref:Uncharacterized protein n=1 Tax=Thlaspi arvense TaxID=13288 RepID=A0AAU9RYU7_THLAR|nr:unnamed protein product [Thlaspi arvense]